MAPRLCLTLLLAAIWTTTTTTQASVVVTIDGGHTNDQQRDNERSLQSGGVFSLYTMPTFVARLSSAVNQHVDDIPFGMIAMEFKTITEEYLEDFFAASLLTADTTVEKVHSVDLQVGVTKPGPSNRLLLKRSLHPQKKRALDEEFRLILRAEVTGSVSFVDPQDVIDKPSNERVQRLLRKFLAKAFDMDALPLYKKRISERATEPILKSIEGLSIETDVGTTFEPPPEEEEPKEGTGSGGGGWDAKDFLICFLTGGFLLCSLACLYVYASRDYHERRKKAYRMTDNGQHHHLDDDLPYKSTNNDSQDDENQVVVTQSNSPGAPRRYRKTPAASPLDVIYGAAFMPHDRERVERERQKRRKKKQQSKRSPIKPMLSIAEEDSISDGSQRSILSFENGIGPWLRQLAACWSPGDKGAKPEYGDPNYIPRDGDVLRPPSEISPHGVDDLNNVVFRDFPRHDGTPCLMYNPANDESSLPSQDVYISNNSTHSTGSLLSIGSTTSTGEVDTFVDKLEHLMVMRHKQYEERMKMEEERAAFRKGKQEAKTKNTNSYLPDMLATNKPPTPQKEATAVVVPASPAAASATPTRHAAGGAAATTPPQTPTGDLLGVAGLFATPGAATPATKSVATPAAAATPAAKSVSTPAITPAAAAAAPAATTPLYSKAEASSTPRTAPPRLGFKPQETTADLLGIPDLVASEQKADKEMLLLTDKQHSPGAIRNLEKSLNKVETTRSASKHVRTEATGYEEEEESEGVFT